MTEGGLDGRGETVGHGPIRCDGGPWVYGGLGDGQFDEFTTLVGKGIQAGKGIILRVTGKLGQGRKLILRPDQVFPKDLERRLGLFNAPGKVIIEILVDLGRLDQAPLHGGKTFDRFLGTGLPGCLNRLKVGLKPDHSGIRISPHRGNLGKITGYGLSAVGEKSGGLVPLQFPGDGREPDNLLRNELGKFLRRHRFCLGFQTELTEGKGYDPEQEQGDTQPALSAYGKTGRFHCSKHGNRSTESKNGFPA